MPLPPMRRCEFDAELAIESEQVVFAAYVDGLRGAGWTGPANLRQVVLACRYVLDRADEARHLSAS
jgi:hypothetical protein